MPSARDWRQHLEIETPEHVVLDYELAGLGSRGLAALADAVILGLTAIVFGLALLLLPLRGWLSGVIIVFLQFFLFWGYFTFFEGFRQGQTPGKRWMGIRVVHDTGHPLTFAGAAIRNLLRLVDLLPPPYLIGVLLIAVHPRGKRLGDVVAGTVVVRDRPHEAAAPAVPGPAEESLGPPLLPEDAWVLLRGYRARAAELVPAARARFAARLAERIGPHLPPGAAGVEAALEVLYHAEAARRRGRQASGSRRADRFVVRKQARWHEFAALAAKVTRHGLDGLAAGELPEFAARYREIAADLARARTYGADPAALGRLERLVAAGHNALYRRERMPLRDVWRFIAVESPRAVVTSWRAVALAAAVFLLPGLAGYAVMREQPPLALEVLPDVLLERAEAGVARAREGQGYFEAPPGERPLVASSIISNNVGVAFRCFAGGVLGGVGSLVLLGFNGLMIGAASGHFANRGLLGYLWTFVAGHGALELFAIWVSGAAGFLLGRALIAPGDLARSEALVLKGRIGIRMVAAATLMLLVAGAIEGFLSASAAPLPLRVGASVGSVVLLAGYLGAGARRGGAPEPAGSP